MPTRSARNVADILLSGVAATAFNTNGGNIAANAFDGVWSVGSRWVGADWNAGQYLRVDLGQSRSIDQWRVYQSRDSAGNDGLGLALNGFPTTYAPNLKLQSSPDDSVWTDRDTRTGLTTQDSGYLTIPGGPFSARYWRILITGGGPTFAPDFYEVEMLATGLTPSVRDSQSVIETVVLPTSANARATQAAVEAVVLPTSANARVSQFAIEVLVLPPITIIEDVPARFRLATSLDTFGDAATRARLIATAYTSVASRFRLALRAFKDSATRSRLFGRSAQDLGTRFWLALVPTFAFAATRSRLFGQSVQHVGARFWLALTVFYKDVATRSRLLARSFITIRVRVRLVGRAFKNVATRVRLIVQAYKNVGSRAYLRARSYKDAKARFRLVWIPWTPDHGLPPLADVISFIDDSSPVIVYRMRSKRSKQSVSGQMHTFDNLDYPRVYFGEWREETWDVTYRIVPGTDQDQFANLKALVSAAKSLKYVNQHGEVIVVAVMEVSVDFFTIIPTKPQDVTLTLTRIDGVLL